MPVSVRREAFLQAEVLRRWGPHPRVRLWRQNSGLLFAPDSTERGFHRVRAAVPGAGDLTGILKPWGRRLEIECKSADGRQTEDQRSFQRMITEFGGLYVLARTMADVDAVLVPLVGAP